MDMTPMSAGSKSSDFSIERILSDRPNCENKESSPSWLCCTRYQPPRLPRTSSVTRAVRRCGRHARVPFTGTQAAALEAAYSRAPYLAPPALRALAHALQLRDDRIKIWFQNRRARERREKNSTITPPKPVTLPPTTSSRHLHQTHPWPPAATKPVGTLSGHYKQNRIETDQDTLPNINDREVCRFNLESNDRIAIGSDNSDDWSDASLDVEKVDD